MHFFCLTSISWFSWFCACGSALDLFLMKLDVFQQCGRCIVDHLMFFFKFASLRCHYISNFFSSTIGAHDCLLKFFNVRLCRGIRFLKFFRFHVCACALVLYFSCCNNTYDLLIFFCSTECMFWFDRHLLVFMVLCLRFRIGFVSDETWCFPAMRLLHRW